MKAPFAALVAVCVAGCAGWDARPLVPANPPLAAGDLAVVDPPAREPVGTLSAREIHRDLEVLVFALRSYDPRATGYLLRKLLPDDLMRLAKRPLTIAELCHQLPELLQMRRHQPKLVVTRASGERCESTLHFPSSTVGRPPPTGDVPFTFETRSTDAGPVAVLAINRFDVRDQQAWRELPRALAAVEAGGLIVDLRQVGGTDPTGGMLLARLLGGRDDLWPVRGVHVATGDITEVLRANHRRLRGSDDVTPPPWAAPVDKAPLEAIRVPRDRRVVVDRGCREACVVTAIALQRGGTRKVGDLSIAWAEGARPGLVVLPHSGLQVEIPTIAVDIEDPVLGDGGTVASTDLLDGTLKDMGRVLAARARVDRWRDHDPPPLCADPERLSAEQVPGATSAKFDSFWRISESPAGTRVGVLIKLSVGLDQAKRLLAACPAATAPVAIETPEGETITTLEAPKEVLFRIANSDVVVRVELGGRLRLQR